MVSKIQEDLVSEIGKIKSDVNHCYEFIKTIDKSGNNKFIELEKLQNVLMKRLNRPDIIVTGLPQGAPNVINSIIKISSIYGISLSANDINQCVSIKNKKEILVKFNSISTRDAIMKKYYETPFLKLKDVVEQGADIDGRVFLSDHLTPMASKLCYICRKLKKEKRITSFKFRNGDVPKAVVKKSNGNEITLDVFNLMEKYQELCVS